MGHKRHPLQVADGKGLVFFGGAELSDVSMIVNVDYSKYFPG